VQLAQIARRCVRTLSPYDCRRHYAALTLGGHYERLTRAQRAGIEAGVEDAKAAAVRERMAESPAPEGRRHAHAAVFARLSTEERKAYRNVARRESDHLALGRDYATRTRTVYREGRG